MLPRYVLLYDGACRFCTAQAYNVLAHDTQHHIRLLALNTREARQRFPQISGEDAQRWMHVVSPAGQIYRGAEAVRLVLLLLPFWRLFGALLYLPGALLLARPLYDWFARNRYRFGGYTADGCADGTCAVHFGRST